MDCVGGNFNSGVAPAELDVGVVVFDFCYFPDFVDESQAVREIFELKTARD